ncbi:potassium channel family protein [Candidatus Chromulinivorax destructor]|uniref:Potassium transporter Trk n=1 Tax=Candidatus Chromulinivorax destructor TaxID=2066483 RepID=A0A345ZCX6_9BACT|nr:TrkA family potassium uptake protein [Candidatus Chromulinivorax destructor]AXK61143.1 potassium transporter Trk [Candidatus Chromulinivorax destructor]
MKFCVIGLGRFGKQVVKRLHENGAEVLAIDQLESNINLIKDYAAQAVCIKIHDEETLEAIGIDEMDVIIIAIGEDFSQSVLLAAMLKSKKSKYKVIARANGAIQKNIFRLIGVDQVICPEEETATDLADTLSFPFTNLARLNANYSVALINPPKNFIGKSIQETNLFEYYHINCSAVQQGENILSVTGNYVITAEDKLIVSGENHKIKQLLHV